MSDNNDVGIMFLDKMVCLLAAKLLDGRDIDLVIESTEMSLVSAGMDSEDFMDELHGYKDGIESVRLSLEVEEKLDGG